MLSRKNNIIARTISISILLLVMSAYLYGFSQSVIDTPFLKDIALPTFTLLTIALILFWQSAGNIAGCIFLSVEILLILLISFSHKTISYNIQLIILGIIAFISYLFYKNSNDSRLVLQKELDQFEESANILQDNIKKDIDFISALSARLNRYNKLKELGETFNAKLSLQEIYKITIEKSCDMIGKADFASLCIISEDDMKLVYCYVKNQNGAELNKKLDIYDTWVVDKVQPLKIADKTNDFRFDYKSDPKEPEFNSLIIVPLVMHNRVGGIIRLVSRKKDAFTEDDLRLLDFTSDLAGSAINNAKLYAKTQELAIKDSLTGLYVLRYFKEKLAFEFSRKENKQNNVSVLMFDIDHFKDYNDKYGHAAGDKVLKGIADIIGKNIDTPGVIARYGGEEFIVLLPGKTPEQAKLTAETIRAEIEKTRFVLRRQETKVTISGGVSSFPHQAKNKEDLLKSVDFLLYKAKKEGRNKICVS